MRIIEGQDDFEAQAMQEIAAMDGQPAVIETDRLTLFMLVAQVQMAMRHPQNQGPSRERVEGFCRDLGAALAPAGSAAARIIEMGWDPTEDIPFG